MVNGPESCPLNVAERLQLSREYDRQYHALRFTTSAFRYSWELWQSTGMMPTTDWKLYLGLGGSISYIVVKPPQRQISICAPPLFTGRREMRGWLVPYDTLMGSTHREILRAPADVSQDLLLVVVRGDSDRYVAALYQEPSHLRCVFAHPDISLYICALWIIRYNRTLVYSNRRCRS